MADKVVHVRSAVDFDTIIIEKLGLIVVEFSAEWCGQCRAIAPKFSEFSNKYSGVTFVHLDIDELTDHPLVKNVSSVPHFKFFKTRYLLGEFTGANVAKLQKTIETNA